MSRQQRPPRQSRIQCRRGAKALVTAANRVLLVEESHADGTTFWTLPGGGLEAGESPPTALRRELVEELRCQTAVGERQAEFWYAHAGAARTVTCYAVFECALLSSPVPNAADGVRDAQWRRADDLPPATLLPVRYLVETARRDGQTNESK